jgi:glycosyltransferase involved in cell wall biosynthesis
MKNLPEYSVVIPAYNAAAFIGETIQSIINQTHPPSQIIVVDDGSEDDLAAVLDAIDAPLVLLRQANQGPGSATTRGLDAVKTEFAATTDSDDLWVPEKIEKQFAVLLADDDPKIVFSRMSVFGNSDPTETIHSGRFGWSRSTLFLSMKTYREVGPFIELPGFVGEVVEWIDRARFKKIKTVMIEECLAKRRVRPGSLSWSKNSLKDGYMAVVLQAMRRRKEAEGA